ncbi:RHS repeat protein [Grimontia sp. S25]|uniref:RHS repeat protein n=1 Tax=Grimontia sedimenti TaxID=2711294 RepID=A0A6M1RAI7_9GAMM|nr:RHS repeat protein [Grimontia sedimenti]NGN97100.1 RHS repeat protein [Grimontia sedimenti]
MWAIFLTVLLIVILMLQSCNLDFSPPNSWLGGGGSGSETGSGEAGSGGGDSDGGDDNNNDDCGAPVWHVDVRNLNLVVRDTPFWLSSPNGYGVEFSLTYNVLANEDKNSVVGSRWSYKYGNQITETEDGNVALTLANGRIDLYEKGDDGKYRISDNIQLESEIQNTFEIEKTDLGYRIIKPNGYYSLYQYKIDETFRLTERGGPNGLISRSHFSNGQLTAVEDSLGRRTHFSYSNSKIISVTGPYGRSANMTYDVDGNLTSITDMEGYTADIGYDDRGYIEYIENALGKTSFYIEIGDENAIRDTVYPAPGEELGKSIRLTITDPENNKSEYFYNSANGNTYYTAPEHYKPYLGPDNNNYNFDVPKVTYSYKRYSDSYSRISKIDYQDDTWIRFNYGDNKYLSTKEYSDGRTEKYTWNDNGLLSSKTNTSGVETTYEYDENENILSVSNGLITETFRYDDKGQVISWDNGSGLTTTFEYNDDGNPKKISSSDGEVAEYQYDLSGYLVGLSKNGESITTLTRDSLGRVVTATDYIGYSTHFTYNDIDTVTSVRYPGDRVVEYEFGACPRLLQSKTLPMGRQTQYGYDNNKNLTEVRRADDSEINLGRDKSGRLTSLTDANQNTTKFEYSDTGKLLKKTYADGSQLEMSYRQGRVQKIVNARGIEKRLTYNDLGQLVNIDYSDDTPPVSYTYDVFGRIETATDQFGTTTYSFTNDGYLSGIDGPLAQDNIEIKYSSQKQVTGILVNGKENAIYEYDSLGRIANTTALGNVFKYHYDLSDSNLKFALDYPNGIRKESTLNSSADLNQIKYTLNDNVIADYQYGYNQAGQVKSQAGTSEFYKPQNTHAEYNNLNQITKWQGKPSLFEYDQDGNPTKGLLADDIPYQAVYDAENRLVQIDFQKDGVSYSERFGYDHSSMLVQYELMKDGQPDKVKRFVRLGLVELQQRDENGNIEIEFVWDLNSLGGIGGLLISKAGDTSRFYIYDYIGNVSRVLNKSGEMTGNSNYTPFGQTGSDTWSTQPYRLSTKRSDFASGLVYFGYRFYSPYSRTWLNRDPLHEKGGLNLYSYVDGNPVGLVDPNGNLPLPIIGGIIGGINGGLGSWVQGGNFDTILESTVAGAIGGAAFGPVGAAAFGNGYGQLLGLSRNGKSYSCFNFGSFAGAAYGAGVGSFLSGGAGGLLSAQFDFYFSTIGSIVGGRVGD